MEFVYIYMHSELVWGILMKCWRGAKINTIHQYYEPEKKNLNELHVHIFTVFNKINLFFLIFHSFELNFSLENTISHLFCFSHPNFNEFHWQSLKIIDNYFVRSFFFASLDIKLVHCHWNRQISTVTHKYTKKTHSFTSVSITNTINLSAPKWETKKTEHAPTPADSTHRIQRTDLGQTTIDIRSSNESIKNHFTLSQKLFAHQAGNAPPKIIHFESISQKAKQTNKQSRCKAKKRMKNLWWHYGYFSVVVFFFFCFVKLKNGKLKSAFGIGYELTNRWKTFLVVSVNAREKFRRKRCVLESSRTMYTYLFVICV